MKFPAGSLAILASKAGNDRHYAGRSSIENWNQFEHSNSREHRSYSQEQHEQFEAPSASNKVLRNKRGNRQMISTIVNKIQQLRQVGECDPLVETEVKDDKKLREHEYSSSSFATTDQEGNELGILSSSFSSSACGVGRLCRKATSAETSSLGGFCEDIEGRDHQEFLRRRGLQEQSMDVETSAPSSYYTSNSTSEDSSPPSYDPSNIVSTMQYVCDTGGLVGYDCVCNFDASDAYVGTGTCTTPLSCTTNESLCGVSVTDCYQTTYHVTLQGQRGLWAAELCLQFLEPYQQKVCYETSTVDSGVTPLSECQLSLDGEVCSTCEVYRYRDNNCYVFDCGNTGQAGNGRGTRIGNTCDFPAHGIGLFLDTYGCPACDLCANPGTSMVMTSPENSVILFNTTYECSYVQEVSMQGFFTPDSCDYFSVAARETCGCAAVEVEGGDVSPEFVQDLPLPAFESAACSAFETCSTDTGDCCPTSTGEFLACCGEISSPADAPISILTNAPSVVATDSPSFSPVAVFEGDEEKSENICNICPNGVTNPDGVIAMPGSNAGENVISCSEIELAGMAGSITGEELCEAVQKKATGPCCGVTVDEDEIGDKTKTQVPTATKADEEKNESESDYCTLCGPGKIHTELNNSVSVPTQGIYTCEELIDMGKNGILDNNGICLLVQTSAQTPCGCQIDGPTMAPTESTQVDDTSSSSSSFNSGMHCLAASAATTVLLMTLSSWNLFW